jgi:hypothetical protein
VVLVSSYSSQGTSWSEKGLKHIDSSDLTFRKDVVFFEGSKLTRKFS